MASKAIGFLNFKFSADLTSFERAMNKAQKKLKKFGKNIQRTGKSLTMGLTLPIVGLGVASIKAFDEQQKAIAQVEAGLKSTGNAVGFTSEKLQKMAADLQTKTLFGDEEILKGATAQLLTFTNITGEQFAKTQEIALDLATRLDGDLKSASIMLGKALNDPIANLSALSRAGIQFSEDQKSTIKSLVETNQLAEAQNIILKELEKQYGGSAEAAAQAGMGPMKQLMNQLSDLSEEIGLRLMPFVKSFTEWILKLAKKFDGLTESTKDNIVKWGLILAAMGPVLIIIGKLSVGISSLIGGFKKLFKFLATNPWIAAAAAIAAVGVAVSNLFKGTSDLTSAQDDLNDITRSAQAAIQGEITEVELLTQELKAQGLSLADKEAALKKLQDISPEYYGGLDAATFTVKQLDLATQNYTATLLQQAKAEAAKQKLVSLNIELLEVEANWEEVRKMNLGADFNKLAAKNYKEQKKNIQDRIKSLAAEYTSMQKSTNSKKEDVDVVKEQSKEVENLTKQVEKLTKQNKKLRAQLSNISEEQYSSVALSIDNYNKTLEIATAKNWDDVFPTGEVNKFAGALGILGDEMAIFFGTNIEEIEAGLESMITTLSGNLAQGAESFKEYGETVKGILKDIIGGLISKGVAGAVSGALEKIGAFGPLGVTMIPLIAGAAAGLARTAFNSLIPAFADGGLVTGPTTALIGEGSGTSMANPEVVAPLDKLKSMIGGGGQNITVQGRLVGNDIYLSNERTKFNRNRTV